jgi:hypothetical protein
MESDFIGDEERNARTTKVFLHEKRPICDLISSQESLVSNLMLQKRQMYAQVAFLNESVARLVEIIF